MMIPDDLQYTDQDEWVRLEGEHASVGITEHRQAALGPLIAVEPVAVGSSLRRGDLAVTLRSQASVHTLAAPLSGTVVAVNTRLASEPGLINADPYGEGWLLKFRIEAGEEIEHLRDASFYSEQIAAAEVSDVESP